MRTQWKWYCPQRTTCC
ncbi:hypothetical protein E2C01_101013 [Portunus trituberculatus]|uniref:Uncharacterized protein n=1 Tax=Portunus trituberculatus TaxID=210409 RepID=A0A5B7KDM8_PORTR|nr:hypothetical protein [Portunus trituberculatus]